MTVVVVCWSWTSSVDVKTFVTTSYFRQPITVFNELMDTHVRYRISQNYRFDKVNAKFGQHYKFKMAAD